MDFMSFIYVLTNKSLINTVKVGMTTLSPEKRASELHTTGIPTPFEVAATWKVPPDELRKYETKAHKALSKYRVSRNREFFEVNANLAIKIINKLIPTPEQITAQKIKEEQKAREARIGQAERAERRRKQLKEDKILELQQKKRALLSDKESIVEKSIGLEKILLEPQSIIAFIGSIAENIFFKSFPLIASRYAIIFWALILFYVFETNARPEDEWWTNIFYIGFGAIVITAVSNLVYMLFGLVVIRKLWAIFINIAQSLSLQDNLVLMSHKDATEKLEASNIEIKNIDAEITKIDQELIFLLPR
jgi:primosomal protein N''